MRTYSFNVYVLYTLTITMYVFDNKNDVYWLVLLIFTLSE